MFHKSSFYLLFIADVVIADKLHDNIEQNVFVAYQQLISFSVITEKKQYYVHVFVITCIHIILRNIRTVLGNNHTI